MTRRFSPLGAVLRGAAAGAVGTAAMDLFLYGKARIQGSHDPLLTWEFGGPSDWEHVSAPAQVGRRLYEGLFQRTLAPERARLTNNVMHWGYGIAWGAAYGVLAGSLDHRPPLLGQLFGASVWGSSYVTLPAAGLYKQIWEYSPSELAPDLAAHLAYGSGVAAAFRLAPG